MCCNNRESIVALRARPCAPGFYTMMNDRQNNCCNIVSVTIHRQ